MACFLEVSPTYRLSLFFVCSEADYDPDTYKIPFVVVSLKALSAHVHSLLQSHEGTIPLLR